MVNPIIRHTQELTASEGIDDRGFARQKELMELYCLYDGRLPLLCMGRGTVEG